MGIRYDALIHSAASLRGVRASRHSAEFAMYSSFHVTAAFRSHFLEGVGTPCTFSVGGSLVCFVPPLIAPLCTLTDARAVLARSWMRHARQYNRIMRWNGLHCMGSSCERQGNLRRTPVESALGQLRHVDMFSVDEFLVVGVETHVQHES